MTGSFVAFVLGCAVVVATSLSIARAFGRLLRGRPDRGLLALSVFLQLIGIAVLVVGLIGVLHEARAGRRPPVPLDVIWAAVLVGFAAMLGTRQRRRMRLREARRERARARAEKTSGD